MNARLDVLDAVAVATPGGAYPVWVGPGAWAQTADAGRASVFALLAQASQIVVVTNDVVGPVLLDAALLRLKRINTEVSAVVLPDGEVHKTLEGLEPVYRALLEREADRKTVLVALGGGVVGDMTGFAAASYMRGIDFVQMPTTLLAQVDSSVGGKTGVNHALGKNMIGAFHQPKAVWCDLDWLQTLPQREYASGLAEVIKYGPIYDWSFFDWLDANMPALVARDTRALVHAVRRSVEIKAEVVGKDEREGGLRAILNFGHTFGHAIEAGLGYGEWLHGEAVAAGMVMASALSVELGHLKQETHLRLEAMIAASGLPTRGPALGAEGYLRWMRVDKKASHGAIRYVLIGDGQTATLERVDDARAARVIDSCSAASTD